MGNLQDEIKKIEFEDVHLEIVSGEEKIQQIRWKEVLDTEQEQWHSDCGGNGPPIDEEL